MIKGLLLKFRIWIIFVTNKEKLPAESKIINPKVEYENTSGALIWEDEGLWECQNIKLKHAFKYVICYRMTLMVSPDKDIGFLRSKEFDKSIFKMAQKFFPNWIGFKEERCTYNFQIEDRILRIKRVEEWRYDKLYKELSNEN